MTHDPEIENVLLQMVQRSNKVHDLTDRELAQIMVDLTGELPIHSYQWSVYMEVAERLCPALFDEAEP